ncbi:hypothetical protein CHGG_08476 [Chaetomium globosum CBS 148.51]|uniref:Uncharacterized protein n=1 Tax=Chaetomium globosum (strain ATCC 6205 / CBS 148.51 / DSM 1962 / NBRC 6347 / NRRL 1970) TaxID=306901 RepID=Q2GU78_CHAGB|nr:uncharacterized protein CHGG_08476 [Chaetomium globosum CBS 148.51]EAQ84462.1 hypothetical protein CHGG_08476 [Chaetomium globosum CBS 148.51]
MPDSSRSGKGPDGEYGDGPEPASARVESPHDLCGEILGMLLLGDGDELGLFIAMSRRAWPNPNGPTGKTIGLVNPINEPQTGNEIWVHETPLPVATMGRFMEFLANHTLPNGQLTTLPTLSSDEISKMAKPYNDWAPPPYNNNSLRGDAAMTRFSLCFAGLPDLTDVKSLFSAGGFDLLSDIDFELEMCRQRLWAGMVPLSDRRWADKKLDALQNIDLAAEHLLKVCDMIHFSMPTPSDRARKAYNQVYDAFTHFDTVLAAHYAATTPNRTTPLPSVANLWADFFFTHTASPAISKPPSPPPRPSPAEPNSPPNKPHLLSQFTQLTHILRRLDLTTLLPLPNFKSTLPAHQPLTFPPPTGLARLHPIPRRDAHAGVLPPRSRCCAMGSISSGVGRLVRDEFGGGWRTMTRRRCTPAEEGHGLGRTGWGPPLYMRVGEAYNTPKLPILGEGLVERRYMWVWSRIGCGKGCGEGGVGRGLGRGLREDVVAKWGEGVKGVEGIRDKMEIRWVDGRDVGIAEEDVDGARKHFKGLNENRGAGMDGLVAPAFLVADKSSVESYTGAAFATPDDPDFGPFILVGKLDEVDPSTHKAPGFEGAVRVLGTVLLDDVWPSLWCRLVCVEDMWNLATWHPLSIYVGSVVHSQVEGWDHFRQLRGEVPK